jgi:putative DNA primase/helicase
MKLVDEPVTVSDAWEDIIPFEDIDTPDISADFLPSWAGAFVHELSVSAQTPPAFAVMLAFSTVATCVQQRICVSPFGDSYIEPLNIWTVGVMPPGSRKTFVQEQLTRPFIKWEREQAESLKKQIHHTDATRAVIQKRIDKLQNDAAREADEVLRKATIHEITQLRESMPEEIRPPRLFTNDCTAEAFQTLLAQHGERMAVLSDEGGIFEVMAGLYTDGRVNLDVFLKSHAGSPVRVDRSGGRTVYLNHPLSTFGLAVQPSIIEELSQGSKRRFRGNGCLARFLYVIPASNVGHRDVIRRHVISETAQSAYNSGIQTLLKLPQLFRDGVEQPRVLRLDREALRYFIGYQQAIEPKQAEGGDLHVIADWTAKLPGAALRLAGLSHIIEYGPDEPVISRATMERSLDLADLLIRHALAAFSLMGVDQTVADAQSVTRFIKAKGEPSLKQNDIYRACHGRIPKVDRLNKALAVLIDRNMISDPITESTGGRPSIRFLVNPKLLTGSVKK